MHAELNIDVRDVSRTDEIQKVPHPSNKATYVSQSASSLGGSQQWNESESAVKSYFEGLARAKATNGISIGSCSKSGGGMEGAHPYNHYAGTFYNSDKSYSAYVSFNITYKDGRYYTAASGYELKRRKCGECGSYY